MSSQQILHSDRFSRSNATAAALSETRRAGHGGFAWARTLSASALNLRQPQDGAQDMRSRLATINSHLTGNLLLEPEDARLTGGTRSLTRRLLGLNGLAGKRKSPESAPIMVKGQPQVA